MGYFATNTNPENIHECLRIAKANLNLILIAKPNVDYAYLIHMAIHDVSRAEKILFEGGVLDSTATESDTDNS